MNEFQPAQGRSEQIAESIYDLEKIASGLRGYGIDFPTLDDLSAMPGYSIERQVAYCIKTEKQDRPEIDLDEVMQKCFGETWKKGTVQ